MKIIELTAENIQQHLEDCLELQSHLLSSDDQIDAQRIVDTATDGHGYFIGCQNEAGKIIGLGLVSKVVDPVRIVGYVNNIVVHPAGRGQGLFGEIMVTLEDRAKAWGCTRLELTCSREAVQGMYEKRGYALKDTNFYYLDIS